MVGQGGTQGSEGVGLEEHQWWDKEVRRGVRGWGWRSTNGGTRRYAVRGLGLEEGQGGTQGSEGLGLEEH